MAVNLATPSAAPVKPSPPSNAQPTDRVAYAYLFPVIFATFFFWIIPFFYVIYISMTNYSLFNFQEYRFIGLENFRQVFTAGSALFPVLGWTAVWMFGTTFLNVGFGMLVAMMLNHPGLRERNMYRTILIIPWALPFILMVQVWAGIFNTQGPLNLILGSLGIGRINWLNTTTPARAAMFISNLWFSYPFFMTVCLAALQSIPRDLYEVSDLDGAGAWARFRFITWPFMLGAITPLIITQLAFQFNNAGFVFLLTEGRPLAGIGAKYGSTDILASYAYKLIFSLRLYGLNAAFSIVLFVIVSIFTIFNARITGSFREAD